MKRSNSGFTLVEILCAVIVVVLLTAMIITGISFGARNYSKNLSISEARTLYCTLATVVSDELRFATAVETDSGGTVTYLFSQIYGEIDTDVFHSDGNGHIYLEDHKLLSNSSYTHSSKAVVDVLYDSVSTIFTVDIAINDSKGSEIYSHDFQVKQLNSN